MSLPALPPLPGRRLRQACLSLSAVLLLSACGSGSTGSDAPAGPGQPEQPAPEPGGRPQALGGAKALVVSIDGLTYEALQQARRDARHPALASLTVAPVQTGGYVGTASEQRTLPVPGWASLLTGTWADQHGLRGVGAEAPTLEAPTLFALAAEPQTAAAAVSTGDYRRLLQADIQAGRVIEAANCTDSDPCVTEQARDYLQQGKSLVLAQLQAPARAAAEHGLGSEAYRKAVEQSLATLDQLAALIETRRQAESSEDWLLIVTTGYGLDEFGGATGSQFNRNKTSFIAANKALPSLPAVDGVVAPDADMNALGAVIDIAPTVLAHLGALGPDYRFRGTGLQAATSIRGLDYEKPADKNIVTLNWTLQGDTDQEVRVLRDGQLVATLPAGATRYDDTLPVSDTAQVYSFRYSVQSGKAASAMQVQAGYKPPPKLAATLKDGLVSYYPMTSLPLADGKGGSTLQPSAAGVPAGALIAADFLDPAAPTGALRILGANADANGQRGYALTLSRDVFSLPSVPQFTLGFWFRTPPSCSSYGYGAAMMANKNYDSGNNPGFALGLFNSGGCDIRFNTGYGGGRNESQGYRVTPNQWAYVAVVIDKTGQVMRGHVFDPALGAQFSSVALETRSIQALGGTGAGKLGVNEDVTGQYYKRWNPGFDVNMDFGELAIWERALSTDELTSIYESRKPLSSLQP
ncbi:MAG: LamG-like jellyroll fold domain-containing protein [Alcaligenes sp.]